METFRMVQITDQVFPIVDVSLVLEYRMEASPKPCLVNDRRCDCFVLPFNGRVKYEFSDGRSFTNVAGNLMYLAHNSVYRLTVEEPMEYIYADFLFLRENDVRCRSDIWRLQNPNAAEAIFRKMLRHWKSDLPEDRLACIRLLCDLYDMVFRSSRQSYLSDRQRIVASETVNYIAAHLSDPNLSCAELVRRSGLSETYFRRIFHACFSASPIRYITDMRIRRAQELLLSTDMTIAEISRNTGFESQFYFSRLFRSRLRATPSEYREVNRFV